jgi:hypothetical protein
MDEKILTTVKANFNNRISFHQKGTNIYQIIAPFFHEDGDMYDLFLDFDTTSSYVRVCDHGHTLMRLSYTYDLDTPKKEEIFYQIIHDNKIENNNGNLYIETPPENLYTAIFRFTQVIAKITNMQLYRREVVRSMFYDDLHGFIQENLSFLLTEEKYLPIVEREELEVDYYFKAVSKPLYLFGIKDNEKAKLVTISCLEYMRQKIPFRSIAVHEDFDALSAKDRKIITNVADKQFTDIEDFRAHGCEYFEREMVS